MVNIISIPDASRNWGADMRTNLNNLNTGVEEVRALAQAAYVVPTGGIPESALSASVTSALSRARSSVQTVNGTAPDANGNVVVSGGNNPVTDADIAAIIRDSTTATRAALGNLYMPELASPGTQGFVATLQALYDNGTIAVNLDPGQVYYWDGILFADSTDPRRTFRIFTNGARVVVNAGVGAAATGYADAETARCLIFDNTKRSAYNSTNKTVNCTNSTCSTGSGARVGVGVGIYDADFRASNTSTGDQVRVLHAFNSTPEYTGRTSYLAGMVATAGYCDSVHILARLTNPESGSGVVASIYRQRGNGDNLFLQGNADARALTADIRYCHGGQIQSVGGGLRLVDCTVKVDCHIEGDERLRTLPPVQVTRSYVTLWGELWTPLASQGILGAVVINDGSAAPDAQTLLDMSGLTIRDVYRSDSTTSDELAAPGIYIQAMNYGSRIRARGVWGVVNRTANDQARFKFSPRIDGATTYQTAIANAGSLIASGEWDLNGTATNIRFSSPGVDSTFVRALGRTAAPSIDTLGSSTDVLGTVPDGTYTYAVVSIDEAGKYSNLATRSATVAANNAGVMRLIVSGLTGSRIGVWRRLGTTGDYTAYAEFGVMQSKVFIWDTGSNVNKRPWQSTVPPVPTTATSVDAVLWNGKALAFS